MRRLTIKVLVMFLTLLLGIVVSAVRSVRVQVPVVDRQTEEYAVVSKLKPASIPGARGASTPPVIMTS